MKKVLLGFLVLVGGVLVAPSVSLANPDTDASEAIRYSGDGGDELGTRITFFDDADDDAQIIGLPWRINFFGHPANALCVSSNGSVSPLLLTELQYDAWSGLDDDNVPVDDENAPNSCTRYDRNLATIANTDSMDVISAIGSDIVLYWDNSGSPDPCDVCDGGSIWWNEIEVDGKEAVAITWDEVSMYSTVWGYYPEYSGAGGSWSGDEWFFGDWTQGSPNTFQIVIVKGDDGNDVDGYDHTIELNYGTMGDGSDGYGSLKDESGASIPGVGGEPWLFWCAGSSYTELDTGLDDLNSGLSDAGIPYSMTDFSHLIEWDRNSLCRWPIGVGSYDADTETGTGYELFADTPVGDLIDGGSSELVGNSRGSAVEGRYVIDMVGGSPLDLDETDYDALFDFEAQFDDYWQSSCDRCTGAGRHHGGGGGGSSEPGTETPGVGPTVVTAAGGRELLPGTLQPTTPITRSDGSLPTVAVGAVEATADGVADPVTLAQGANGEWSISGSGMSLTIDATPGAAPTITDDESVAVSGSDLEPGSLVDVWAFSTPTFLGSFTVGSDGTFRGAVTLPAALPAGDHTLQINGTSADGRVRSVNVGVRVVDSNFTLPKTGGNDMVAIVALWLIAAGVFVMATRRRRVIG